MVSEFFMGAVMYDVYCKLRDSKGVKDATVAKATGINQSTFTDWRTGRSVPKKEKLQKIADYFGVTLDYLMTGQEQNAPYYLNNETRDIAQFLFENPNYKVMFDAVRKVKPEDLAFIKELIDRTSR